MKGIGRVAPECDPASAGPIVVCPASPHAAALVF